MKFNLIQDISLFLLEKGYIVKSIKSCFDLLARKDSQILLIKLLEDINSVYPEQLNEMKKLSSYLNASPLIISEKRLKDFIVYQRSGIFTINPKTFKDCINSKFPFVISKKSGLTANLLGKELKNLRLENNLSLKTLSRKIGVSPRTIAKYESDNIEISLKNALKMYGLFGGKIFKPINIFNNEYYDIIHEEFSDISKKFHFLGFEAIETKKLPFDILAKKESNILLTKTGDKIHKELISFSKLLEVNDLVIFNNKKPKNIPSLKKEKFLDLDSSEELIEIINEHD